MVYMKDDDSNKPLPSEVPSTDIPDIEDSSPPVPESFLSTPTSSPSLEPELSKGAPMPQGMDMNEQNAAPGVDTPSFQNAEISQNEVVDPQFPGNPKTPPQFEGVPGPNAEIITQKVEKSKFPYLIGILIVLAIAIYGFVAYLYFGNQKLKEESQSKDEPESTVLPTPQPTVGAETFQYLIDNGSIKKVSSKGTEEIIVSKDNYEDTGIAGFTNVVASAPGNYICFWSLPPALGPALYYSDSKGTTPVKIADKSKNCIWATTEDKLAYINDVSEGKLVDIYLYTIATDSSQNLTEQTATTSGVFRRYAPTSFSPDGAKVLCSYEEIDTENPSLENLGNCEVNISTGEVKDL